MHRIHGLAAAGALLVSLTLPAVASAAADRNHDRIPDRWERAHRLSLRVNQAHRDQDRDGLFNRSEYLDRTNPRRKDSDRDGVPDGREDADHDGVTNADEQEHAHSGDAGGTAPHDEPVATVASFADGKLDVRQADGTDVVATVDDATRLLCAPPVEHSTAVACPVTRLVPGTRVLTSQRTRDHWDFIVLRAAPGDATTPGDDPPQTSDPPHEPDPPATPPPPQPIGPVAPPSTGVISAIGDGSITITRPSGEVVPGRVRASTVLRCIRVADGHVVSNEPCGTSHLAVGKQVAYAQRSQIEGAWTWTTITMLEPMT
jgi:hypothetical protein